MAIESVFKIVIEQPAKSFSFVFFALQKENDFRLAVWIPFNNTVDEQCSFDSSFPVRDPQFLRTDSKTNNIMLLDL